MLIDWNFCLYTRELPDTPTFPIKITNYRQLSHYNSAIASLPSSSIISTTTTSTKTIAAAAAAAAATTTTTTTTTTTNSTSSSDDDDSSNNYNSQEYSNLEIRP